MPSWLGSIVAAVFKAGLDYLKLWYNEEKAKTHEWNAKTREAQLKSVKDAEKMQLHIREAKPTPSATPSDWNRGALIVLLAVLIPLSGCGLFTKYIHVPARMPYIVAPARPTIPVQPQFMPRETILKDYALTLEAKIKAYNAEARRENIKNGYEDAPTNP